MSDKDVYLVKINKQVDSDWLVPYIGRELHVTTYNGAYWKIKSLDESLDGRTFSKSCAIVIKEESRDYDFVNHPQHYKNYSVEVIDMIERIWGVEATIHYCEGNALKYRMRAGTKPGISLEQDFEKEKWYLNKVKELKQKLICIGQENK